MHRALFFTAAVLIASTATARDAEHAFQSSVARGGVRRVTIDVPFGAFTVRNGAPGQIALSGIASRDYDGQRERAWAQKVVDDTSLEIYVNGPEAVVRRRFGANAQSWRARKFTGYDVRIDIPPGIDVVYRKRTREAVRLLMGEGAGCGIGLGEAAVTMVRPVRTRIPVVVERDERTRRGPFRAGQPSLGHRGDDTGPAVRSRPKPSYV